MRIIICYDTGEPHGLGRRSLIVDDVTYSYVNELRTAKDTTPDLVLTIPNARLHVVAGSSGTATLKAGQIAEIREA